MTRWMLVVNLVFVLLLLLAARKRWFANASDDALKRREFRRNALLCLCLIVGVNVGLPVLSAKLDIHPAFGYWGGILAISGIVSLYQRLFPRAQPPPPLDLPETLRFEIPSRVAKAVGVLFERHRLRASCAVQCDEDEALRLLESIHHARSGSDDPLFRHLCREAVMTIQRELDTRNAARFQHERLKNPTID